MRKAPSSSSARKALAAATGRAPASSMGGALAAATHGGPVAPLQRNLGRAVEQNSIGGFSSPSSFTDGATSSTAPCLNHGCSLNLQILQLGICLSIFLNIAHMNQCTQAASSSDC
ncbi:unnamed protein product [Urochloa humidicola]